MMNIFNLPLYPIDVVNSVDEYMMFYVMHAWISHPRVHNVIPY